MILTERQKKYNDTVYRTDTTSDYLKTTNRVAVKTGEREVKVPNESRKLLSNYKSRKTLRVRVVSVCIHL